MALGFVAAAAQAQSTVTPEDEYKKLIKVSEDIQPLGDMPFGEQIGLYDGSLSFRQVDVTVPGTGPTIVIARQFNLHTMDERPDLQNRAFGDWELELPQIDTVTPDARTNPGWLVDASNRKAICTNFGAPPSVPGPRGDTLRADWEPDDWWQGYQMKIPGAGSQELLSRDASYTSAPGVAGLSYPIVTKQDWAVGCLAQASNDATLQAFLAVAPDGTKYWLDHVSYRYMPDISRPLGSGPRSLAAKSDASFRIAAANSDILSRREGRMLATRVEDRFGNWVSYSYNGDLVTDITASDGRHVTIAYEAGTPRITRITVDGGAGGSRTWSYGYTYSSQTLITGLTSVTQPDGSTWSFNLDDLNRAFVDMRTSHGSCDTLGTPKNLGTTYTGRMTHPSGLAGAFTVTPLRRGRAYVPQICVAGPGMPVVSSVIGTWASIPNASYSMAITQRQFSGAGIGTQAWNYTYSPANESWAQNCGAGCATSIWTKTVYPDGHAERSTFSNRYDWTESLLQSEEVFDGDADTSTRRQLTQYGYVPPDAGADSRAGAYPISVGWAEAARVNRDQLQKRFPQAWRVLTRDGDTFSYNVAAFDNFARARQVQRYSSTGYSITEQTSYQDDYARWVLGLPLQTDNLTTNETVSRNVYDPSLLTLSERYRFGRKVMGYAFDAQGQLASFTDGNGHTTGLENYYRGVPRLIRYPDGTAQTVAVDDLGQVTAIADQSGAVTSYGYDAIGRLARIDYPAGDSTAWAPKTFSYGYIGTARGIGGSHWMRLVTQGNWSQRTDYDAMLRPVALGTAEANTGAGYVSSRTDYDWAGRKTFQSYAVDGMPDLAGMALGTVTRYDVLGRPIQQFQHTELGDLLTSTEYLAGGARRVTDPKGNATTTRYQMLDQPSYDSVIAVEAPEGVTQTIQRDIYGNPLSITQGGQGLSLTKTMTYDGEHRLCRTWEPESGSEIMAYDGASNLAWSVSGASFNGVGCGQDQVADALKTVRGYDAMNRVTSVVYPAGTEPSTFTYDSRGNPATATNGMVSWAFGRDKRGLLRAEVLTLDEWRWSIGYDYTSSGYLRAILYPDGVFVDYAPNALGQPTQASGYASGVSYFADGDVKSYTLGSGAIYAADKNARQLLRNFTYGKNGTPNVSEDFAYDANGNVSQINDVSGANQRSKAMGYDGLNRLVSATASQLWGTESYTYDTLNNIRTLTNGSGTASYNYDGSNLLRSIGNGASVLHTFNYDARGNTTAKDSQTLNFDLANRLTSIPGKGSYIYDAAGRRVKKVTPQGTTYYAYNAAGQLMWEYDPATTNGTKYVYLGKKLVANAKASTSKVIGTIDGVTGGDSSVLSGWACSTGIAASIDVHVYIGGEFGTGTVLGAFKAAEASDASVDQACHANGHAYRFAIPVPEATRVASGGQPIYVYGISPVGADNSLLSGSGQVAVPRSANAPDKPSSASATPNGDQSTISVAWSASTKATRYEVWQVYNGQRTSAYKGNAVSMVAASPNDGAYIFEVAACNDSGCSEFARTAQVNIAHVPPAPGAISVPATSTGAVAISWPAATYATFYQLEHSVDGNWAVVYSGGATQATVNETSTGNWYYRVKACNANGCGGYATSGAVGVTIPPSQPPTLNGGGTSNDGSYGLSWSGSPGATVYYLVESVNGADWTGAQYATAQSWSVGGRNDGSYRYMVQGCNSAGCTGWSNTVTITVAHVPPRPNAYIDVTYSIGRKFAEFTMKWDPAPYATSYQIIRYPANTIIYNTNGSSFSLEVVPKPYLQQYTYAIRACNAVGCSAWSDPM